MPLPCGSKRRQLSGFDFRPRIGDKFIQFPCPGIGLDLPVPFRFLVLFRPAGELAHLWVIAIGQKIKLRDLSQMIAPYPTWGEIDKAAASEFSRSLLTSRSTRAVVRMLSWLP